MALLQDLIRQIDDPALRERILQETDKLIKQKKFGLVFEEHLPECTPLYDVPIRVGSKVALKTGYVSDIYTVLQIDGNEVPPYNTGAKDWKYNNDYVDSKDAYRHSKWLSMMEKRLRLAKKLLNPVDSVLIVTIDEKEYLHLGCLLEEIFSNAIMQMVSITINPSGAKRDTLFSRSDEYAYILLFGNAQVVHPRGDGDEREVRWWYLRRTDYSSRRGTVKGGTAQFYPIYVNDDTMKIVHIGDALTPEQSRFDVSPIEGTTPVFPVREDGVEMNWGVTGDTLRYLNEQGVVRVSSGSDNQPYVFRYLSANYTEKIENGRWAVRGLREDGTKIVVETGGKITRATTVWQSKLYDAGQYGTSLLGLFIGSGKFSFPKSLYSVHDSLKYFVSNKKEALIVDFFAGSGTTLHAVNLLNAEDNGRRRCVLITNNEVSNEEAEMLQNQGYKQGDEVWENFGIARSVTWPRTVNSIKGIDIDGNVVEGFYGAEQEEYFQEKVTVIDENNKKKQKIVYIKRKVPNLPRNSRHKNS